MIAIIVHTGGSQLKLDGEAFQTTNDPLAPHFDQSSTGKKTGQRKKQRLGRLEHHTQKRPRHSAHGGNGGAAAKGLCPRLMGSTASLSGEVSDGDRWQNYEARPAEEPQKRKLQICNFHFRNTNIAESTFRGACCTSSFARPLGWYI